MSTVSLGGVVLSSALVIQDRDISFGVEQSVRRTLGGDLKVFFAKLTKGVPITLVATEEYGWMPKTTIDQLYEMAGSAGSVYEFLVNGVSRSVVFRHNEPPAFEAVPLVYRNNQEGTDYYTCTIKLLTI